MAKLLMSSRRSGVDAFPRAHSRGALVAPPSFSSKRAALQNHATRRPSSRVTPPRLPLSILSRPRDAHVPHTPRVVRRATPRRHPSFVDAATLAPAPFLAHAARVLLNASRPLPAGSRHACSMPRPPALFSRQSTHRATRVDLSPATPRRRFWLSPTPPVAESTQSTPPAALLSAARSSL